MALLTEEQIEQLVKIASVTSTVKSYHDKFCEWNEKQTTQQIEPDWSKASDDAVSAVVHVTWVNKLGTWIGSNPVIIFERPTSVITPHPHAEIMAKYAEVASRRVDPWVEFERFSHCDMEWDGLPYHPDWTQGQTYRHIGDKK